LALPTPQTVERLLKLPSWHWTHNQGDEGACVGFGGAMMKAILDGKRFNPWWLWDRSKMIDEWPETVPGDDQGTSVRASCEVMRAAGMVPLKTTGVQPAYSRTIHTKVGDMASGIKTYRWATTVDQMRAGLAAGVPISIGVNWYAGFDAPTTRNNEQYIFIGKTRPRGGHCVCVYGASDSRQAFRVKNSWGRSYPLVWLPYTTMARLLNEQGEAALVTDR
jgi:hypothetical protein